MDAWIKGMDMSTLLEVEECGGRFFDHGREGDAIEILKKYGMNLLRLRVWNDPYTEYGEAYGAGTASLERMMVLAKRAKALGIGWLLDLHYSDFWVDPEKQNPPKAWKDLTGEELEETVYTYTRHVMETVKEAGLLPEMVAVGNEITNGLLWPYGKTPQFDHIVRLLRAGILAVRETAPEVSVMLHLDNGGNKDLYQYWFGNYFSEGGEDFDYIGLSYYPFWHGTLQDLEENMCALAARYHKKMIVAEVSTAFTLEDYKAYEQLPDEKRNGMATKPATVAKVPYPMTPEGQKQFMKDLMEVIRRVPDRLGCGFIYWEPAWLPVPGSEWATPEAIVYMNEKGAGGNEWANQALFDYDGHALPALETIRDF